MFANFTGTWELIPHESRFGFLPPPSLRVDTIVHEESRILIQTRQKDTNGDNTVIRDINIGAEVVLLDIRGRLRWIRATWQDDGALLMETTSEVSGNPRRIQDRWKLGTDAQWLMIERLFQQSGGNVHQWLWFKRVVSAT
jgi:hypothetical protein